MPTPRENTSIVKAPVLFRLPHLQRAVAAGANVGKYGDAPSNPATNHASAANTARGAAPICQSSVVAATTDDASQPNRLAAETSTTGKSAAPTVQSERLESVTDESFLSRWGIELKRSVILLAAIALLWGAWAMGQKSATAPNESNLAETGDIEPASQLESVAKIQSNSEPSVEFPGEPRVAHIVEPSLNSTSRSSRNFEPVIEPKAAASELSTASDTSVGNASTAISQSDVTSDFSQNALDTLEPPTNGEFYGDYDLVAPDQSLTRKPPVTAEAAPSNQTALNQPTASPSSETAVPTATNFVPSSMPEMPGFDPNTVGNPSNAAPKDNRPVFSSTPNGIIDWSRYLPGAGGSGSIRAVSATQTIGGAADESDSADTQAIYLDENDPNAPGVGVAPYYR